MKKDRFVTADDPLAKAANLAQLVLRLGRLFKIHWRIDG